VLVTIRKQIDKNALKHDKERSDNIPLTYLTLPLFIEAPVKNPESEQSYIY
jgi:hypothetical protein